MPTVGTADEHRRGCPERLSDRSVGDQPPARLVGAAEERVRRAAETKPLLLRGRDELPAFAAGRGKRLLGVDVLARIERGAHDSSMRLRWREIEHELDLGIGNQRVDGQWPQSVLARETLGELGVEIGAGDRLPVLERCGVLDVARCDDPAAHDADS